MRVPMNDLGLQYVQLQEELDGALDQVLQSCSFIGGPQVEAFEEAFARFCQVRHCIGVSNGTDALVLALKASDIGPGDEVITSPFTFGATLEAICQVGARPVLADIEADTFNLDPEQVRLGLTPRTKVLLPVHIYGQTANMGPLLDMAQEHGLTVIEDAAQAHGAGYRERPAGSLGTMACFSFYPGKNLGAYGDAGGITTDNDELAQRLRRLRNHGQDPRKKFWYQEVGYNHRMDGLQGAVLGVKLRYLQAGNQRRRQLARRYGEGLADIAVLTLPQEAPYAHHIYHLYVVRSRQRDDLAAALKEAGIATTVYYPHPAHLTDAYRFLGYDPGALPEAERACQEVLALPLFPDMEDAQADYVIAQVRRYFA
ncbi:MAG: aminotransferase class I/II-fold pyridoxal phosphate-dependent enzyme [Candidatus Latescibacteria bacterium]|nr:aminotransferase class I/II-fold pyridoxal phosphate-dependent enzyme [Candidatus Latescibacterota bacterium]